KTPQNSSRHSGENLPSSCNNNSATCISPNNTDDCPFTKGEAATVIHHLSKGKAPGPDGIDNIIQQIFKKSPFLLMKLFTTFLKLAKFPNLFKCSWIKAQAGYIGIEEADRLAKEAAETENFPETPLELPKSFIKTFLRQKIMTTWELASDEDTGRLIHNIIPKVSLQQI
ncbi:hypothetical protein AVEN_172994-1, partial [Araneus ventricosus]